MVELHSFLGAELCKDGLALFFGQPAEVHLILIAQELPPLRRMRERVGAPGRDRHAQP